MPDRPLAFRDHRGGAHLPVKPSISRPCSQNTDPALNTQHSFPSGIPRHHGNPLKHWKINIRNVSLLSTLENKSLPVVTGLFFTIFSPLPRQRKWQDAGKCIRSLSPLLFVCLRRRLMQLATCSRWKWANSKGKGYQGTHCGWSLYKVPSTPTVICKCSTPRFSLFFSTIAASPAPQSWAALLETAPHTSFTMMLSSHVLSRPSCCRIRRTWRRASRSLRKGKHRQQRGVMGSSGRQEPLQALQMRFWGDSQEVGPLLQLSYPPFVLKQIPAWTQIKILLMARSLLC